MPKRANAARSRDRWATEEPGDFFAPSGYRLNPKHVMLLDGLQRGEPTKAIGPKAGYSVATTKEMLFMLRREFRAETTAQLIAIWVEWKALRAGHHPAGPWRPSRWG